MKKRRMIIFNDQSINSQAIACLTVGNHTEKCGVCIILQKINNEEFESDKIFENEEAAREEIRQLISQEILDNKIILIDGWFFFINGVSAFAATPGEKRGHCTVTLAAVSGEIIQENFAIQEEADWWLNGVLELFRKEDLINFDVFYYIKDRIISIEIDKNSSIIVDLDNTFAAQDFQNQKEAEDEFENLIKEMEK
ncbi:MAG: hypothetical protein ACOYMB_04150 [Patescibacteria group bacterium]